MKGGTSEGREGEQKDRVARGTQMADCNTNYAIRTCYHVRLHLSINSCIVTEKRLIDKRNINWIWHTLLLRSLRSARSLPLSNCSLCTTTRFHLRQRKKVRDPAFFQRINVDVRSCKKYLKRKRRLKHEGVCITWCSPVCCLGHIPSGASRLSESSR